MTRALTLRRPGRKLASLALGAALLLLVGDRAQTAGIGGIDPLEILNLSVKPNVIVVLDSSGSMAETLTGNGLPNGDWPDSKMFKAKQVLKTVIQAQESRVSFLFGQYTQNGTGPNQGVSRFIYRNVGSTDMAANEIVVRRAINDTTNDRGLQDWQFIEAGWNTLYYQQQTTGVVFTPTGAFTIGDNVNDRVYYRQRARADRTNRFHSCVIDLSPALNGVYDTEAEFAAFATALTTRMQPGYAGTDRVCTPHGSSPEPFVLGLTLSFSNTTGLYSINRNAGSGTNDDAFQVIRSDGPNNVFDDLGFPDDIPAAAVWSDDNDSDYTAWIDTNAAQAATGSLGGSVPASALCQVTIPTGFYQTGAALATAMQDALNANRTACVGSTANSYTVTYDVVNGTFSFALSGSQTFRMRWSVTPDNIGRAMGNMSGDTGFNTGTKTTNSGESVLARADTYQRTADNGTEEYWVQSRRFLNGHVITVTNDGRVCSMTTGTATNPPSITLRRVNSASPSCTGTLQSSAVFTLNGSNFSGASDTCGGFQSRVPLQVCNAATSQFSLINPLLANELPLAADGLSVPGYTEANGTTDVGATAAWAMLTGPTNPGIVADGSTPIEPSLVDIKAIFNDLWFGTANPAIGAGVNAISGHSNPKERTIVLFVTDGDDTCADIDTDLSDDADRRALAAAYAAQLLYAPIDNNNGSTPAAIAGSLVAGVFPNGSLNTGGGAPTDVDAASSVGTYVVGFGNGAQVSRLNWIAWGGSGMMRATVTDDNVSRWDTEPASKGVCTNCRDAYVAPDAATLEAVLNSIIEQGSTAGAFTAQQSVVASVFEMVAEVDTTQFSPNDPATRYAGILPIQFQASFEMPGFKGKLRALQLDPTTNTIFTKWEAGQKLYDRVTNGPAGNDGMNQITPVRSGAIAGQGTFSQLHASAGAAANVVMSSFGSPSIKRRIYTTTRNGSFGLGASAILDTNLASLRAGTSPNRTTLWPPTTTVAPTADATEGSLDAAMGLPTEAQITAGTIAGGGCPTVPLPTSGTSADCWYNYLQTTFKACLGTNRPAACTTAGATRARRARRETREMVLAYTAGAEFVPDPAATTPQPLRVSAAPELGEVLYQARTWVLAESTLAAPALVGPPITVKPTVYTAEYTNYIDGPEVSGVKQNGLTQGFGLTNPDKDTTTPVAPPTPANDTRTALKPVMSMAYLAANDMLHAFRAGPNCATPGGAGPAATYAACADKGGEEAWGFVPYDRLVALPRLMLPQTRTNKTFVIASPLRFGDVFVDAPGGTLTASVGSATVTGAGMWRTFLMFGRGAGGKFVTTLDITGRGAYTTRALDTQAPIVMWSRGNPDSPDGLTTNATNNNNATDRTAYSKMGETWSTPAIAYVDRATNVTSRRPYTAATGAGGVPMVAYMGSGYCQPCGTGEGTTFFTLDITTGDVVAAVDVEAAATAANVNRTGMTYANAIVAGPVAFSRYTYDDAQPGHPASPTTRVYVGDLHGRLWKFLSAAPGTALLMADLGANQAIGTSAALLGLPADGVNDPNIKPYVYLTSGNDSRATGPFKMFGFRDDGDNTTTTVGSATTTSDPDVKVYPPAVFQFARAFGLANFRGTIQPATAYASGGQVGRVFFGGTRFNLPGSTEAPVPPPCRSSFDSIIFALGASTGGAAYDLNSSGDDAYLLFTNSRKTAIQVIKQPTPTNAPPGTAGRGMLMIDEGLMGASSAQPPPAPGLQPQIPGPPSVGLASNDATTGRAFTQMVTPKLCQ